MKHWHLRAPSYKKVSHNHEGGDRYHQHKKLRGYGRKRNTIKIKVRSKAGLNKLPSELVGYAVITRMTTALF